MRSVGPDARRAGRDGWPEAYDYTVGSETVRFRQDEGRSRRRSCI